MIPDTTIPGYRDQTPARPRSAIGSIITYFVVIALLGGAAGCASCQEPEPPATPIPTASQQRNDDEAGYGRPDG